MPVRSRPSSARRQRPGVLPRTHGISTMRARSTYAMLPPAAVSTSSPPHWALWSSSLLAGSPPCARSVVVDVMPPSGPESA
ncbi:hypothetical protein GA0115246_107833 [Streptomyces sp. SolWspMP-sol7th]|nr:hypothetical protein GA0115246_107833 [Streptomyces sp. SolWspMP-sol7th]